MLMKKKISRKFYFVLALATFKNRVTPKLKKKKTRKLSLKFVQKNELFNVIITAEVIEISFDVENLIGRMCNLISHQQKLNI